MYHGDLCNSPPLQYYLNIGGAHGALTENLSNGSSFSRGLDRETILQLLLGMGAALMKSQNEYLESIIQQAIRLIKNHITEDETRQNRELHKAVGLVVDFARAKGHCQ